MKQMLNMPWLLLMAMSLSGCGGGKSPSSPPSDPQPETLSVAGNWQFSITSKNGQPSTIYAGAISQSEASVTGELHINGSTCFDYMNTIVFSGSTTGKDLSISGTTPDGQVISLTGTLSATPGGKMGSSFDGTYNIHSGCADGDQGTVTGHRIFYLANNLQGTFTTSSGEQFDVEGQQSESNTAGPHGGFGIIGTFTFQTSCLSSGNIVSGDFPAGSFILGTSVALEIATKNGTVTFTGTLDETAGQISGTYAVAGGTCDGTGTAVLALEDPWGY